MSRLSGIRLPTKNNVSREEKKKRGIPDDGNAVVRWRGKKREKKEKASRARGYLSTVGRARGKKKWAAPEGKEEEWGRRFSRLAALGKKEKKKKKRGKFGTPNYPQKKREGRHAGAPYLLRAASAGEERKNSCFGHLVWPRRRCARQGKKRVYGKKRGKRFPRSLGDRGKKTRRRGRGAIPSYRSPLYSEKRKKRRGGERHQPWWATGGIYSSRASKRRTYKK